MSVEQRENRKNELQKQCGFSLIESMVTLFILTVGILGVAGLQAVAISSQNDSTNIIQATALANNMAERVRANLQGVKEGAYDQTGNANTGSNTSSCYTTSGCSAQEMAHTDIYEWQNALESLLPEGKGVICRDSTVPSRLDIDNSELRNAVLASCDGTGDSYVIHVMWERSNNNELELVSNNGVFDPNSSDGYVQLVFVP